MTHKYYILSVALAAGFFSTEAFAETGTREFLSDRYTSESVLRLIQPSSYTYTQDVVPSPDFSRNWFVSLNGGINSFIGSPVGCGDIGDKFKPQLGIGFGKWFTPSVGSRLSVWGGQINSADHISQKCWGISSDMLWNLTNSVYDKQHESRFQLVPYLGMAILSNRTTQKSPFALSYGFIGQVGLTNRLKATLEFGGKTTFSDFDGIGQSNRFGGDNIFTLSAGLSFTLGTKENLGFRRVIDSEPVLLDNSRLKEICENLLQKNKSLSHQVEKDSRALAELKKIMRIKGLLSQYGYIFRQASAKNGNLKSYPVNDYSGLNSLRARLYGDNVEELDYSDGAFGDWIAGDEVLSELGTSSVSESSDSVFGFGKDMIDAKSMGQLAKSDLTGSLAEIKSGMRCIGSPIHIFFKIGTTDLTDKSQSVNLDEIARVVKHYDLKVKVIGSADSATGSEVVNNKLGRNRAEYISDQLHKRGVLLSRITKHNAGGGNTLNPTIANRNCRVELYY